MTTKSYFITIEGKKQETLEGDWILVAVGVRTPPEKLLLLTRADAGALLLKEEAVEFSSMCRDLVEDAEILAVRRKITTKFYGDGTRRFSRDQSDAEPLRK
jgi:signal transduction histidine kinase